MRNLIFLTILVFGWALPVDGGIFLIEQPMSSIDEVVAEFAVAFPNTNQEATVVPSVDGSTEFGDNGAESNTSQVADYCVKDVSFDIFSIRLGITRPIPAVRCPRDALFRPV